MNWVSEKSKLKKQRSVHYRNAERDREIQRRRHPAPVTLEKNLDKVTPKRRTKFSEET